MVERQKSRKQGKHSMMLIVAFHGTGAARDGERLDLKCMMCDIWKEIVIGDKK